MEERLEAAKRHALSQTESIDLLFRTITEISAEARDKRLMLDKRVKAARSISAGPAHEALKIRYRPPYNCRHTYATICVMSGMNPAFIAQQLGHSVQMLLSTYARWLNSSGDWEEMDKLQNGPGLAQALNTQRVTP